MIFDREALLSHLIKDNAIRLKLRWLHEIFWIFTAFQVIMAKERISKFIVN